MRPHIALAVLAAAVTISCASIMHGTTQDLGVSSSPTAAKVTIDNAPGGTTPVIAKLKRGSNHIIKIELTGYAPFEATVTKKVSGWVWGNIVFGGLIGLAVDAMTGGLYNLTPEQVQGQLAKQGASMQAVGDGIYVVLVAAPDSGWTRIGRLRHDIGAR